MSLDNFLNLYPFVKDIVWPIVVGWVVWRLGEKAIGDRLKSEAIRDLMTYRGDPSSVDFRRSLNKVSITFHKDTAIRKEIRELYETINNPASAGININRKTVGLIYDLCQKNGFENVSEYDIDQAFPESEQTPPQTAPVSHDIKNKKEVLGEQNHTNKSIKVRK